MSGSRAVMRIIVSLSLASPAVLSAATMENSPPSPATNLEFERDIRPLFARACAGCHATGGAAIPLGTHDDVEPLTAVIQDQLLERRMPPWPAVRGFGLFRNAPPLTQRDVERIIDWVQGGAPRGSAVPIDPLETRALMPVPEIPVTLKRRPAAAEADFQSFDAALPNERPHWITEIRWTPPSPTIRSASFFIRTAGRAGRPPVDSWIGSWSPGQQGVELPIGSGIRVDPQARLVVTLRAWPASPARWADAVSAGVIWTASPPAMEVQPLSIRLERRGGGRPAGSVSLKSAAWVVGLRPGFQPAAASVQITGGAAGGSHRVLLRTAADRGPGPDGFHPKTPVLLPAGARLEAASSEDATDDVGLLVIERKATDTTPPAWPPTSPGSRPWTTVEGTGFTCPMHPQVHRDMSGACYACGMDLIPVPAIAQDFDLELTTGALTPGVAGEIVFGIRNPVTGELVTKFLELHERLLHVFIVSEDLSHFEHVHPEPRPDGRFALPATLPAPGLYKVFVDFHPAGGAPQLLQDHVMTAGFEPGLPHAGRAALPAAAGRAARTEPTRVVPGEPFTLAFTLTEADFGSLTSLQPYLGALAHIIIVSEDLEECLHAHPSEATFAAATTPLGIRLSSKLILPREGRYRVWMQFMKGTELVTTVDTIQAAAPR
jgi:hypothetical protein